MHVIGNLLKYPCAKNYQDRAWLDKVITKITRRSFLTQHEDAANLTRKNSQYNSGTHMVYLCLSYFFSHLSVCGYRRIVTMLTSRHKIGI